MAWVDHIRLNLMGLILITFEGVRPMRTSHHLLAYRSISLVAALASAGVVLAALLYTFIFHQALIEEDMHGMTGFARVVIPDTFLYKTSLERVIGGEIPIEWLVFTLKNGIGPAFMWYLAENNWYSIAAINGLLIFISLLYFSRISRHYKIEFSATTTMAIYIGLAPILIYYSIGSLKELPTLLGFLGFLYHYLKNQTHKWLFYVFLLIFFRYQIIVPIAAFVTFDKVFKNPLKVSVFTMLAVACLYPYINSLSIFTSEATAIFREDQASSVGAYIEGIRETMPVLSALAVLFRVIQSMFEPILTFIANPTFYENESISVYLIVNFIQNVTLAPYWMLAVVAVIRESLTHKTDCRDIKRLYALIVLFVVSIGGFSFIHHRYLFPISGFVLIAGLIELSRRRAFRMQRVMGQMRDFKHSAHTLKSVG